MKEINGVCFQQMLWHLQVLEDIQLTITFFVIRTPIHIPTDFFDNCMSISHDLRYFQIQVSEPSVDETILILEDLRERYKIHNKLHYTGDALVAAAKLSLQYKVRYKIHHKLQYTDDALVAAAKLSPQYKV
ncbi:hypothetical protein Ccrd_010344, partial [Cynara cardunculus var. scolymus]